MATVIVPASPQPRPPWRFTVEQYHKLIDAGVLTSDDRCELIHGLIVEKPVINPPHANAVNRLMKRLMMLLGPDAVIGVQQPITLPPDNEPEPDLFIASGTDDDYGDRHPGPRDVQLAVEVADSSLAEDRTTKLGIYAAYRLPVYWIVNLVDYRVEVYTDPRGGKNPTYRARQDYGPNDKIPVTLAGRTVGSIPVREILPR
jgi:Uma2 family endonuclease